MPASRPPRTSPANSPSSRPPGASACSRRRSAGRPAATEDADGDRRPFARAGCKFTTRFCAAAMHTPVPRWVIQQHRGMSAVTTAFFSCGQSRPPQRPRRFNGGPPMRLPWPRHRAPVHLALLRACVAPCEPFARSMPWAAYVRPRIADDCLGRRAAWRPSRQSIDGQGGRSAQGP
jgi:hypothetical protein